jgi:hypothetical protein
LLIVYPVHYDEGTLSERMRREGNVWKTLWRDSPRLPANEQRLLFDPIREGEKVLHYLENEPPPAVFAQLLAAAAAAVGNIYASARGAQLSPAPAALRAAAECAAAVLSRACPYENEYAGLAGQMQRAERAVARGEVGLYSRVFETLKILFISRRSHAYQVKNWFQAFACKYNLYRYSEALVHRLPRVAPRLLEELLALADADDAARDEDKNNDANANAAAAAAAAASDETLNDDDGVDGDGDGDGAVASTTTGNDSGANKPWKPRPVEAVVQRTERGPLLAWLPAGGGGAEAAMCAEYALR